MSEGNAMTEIDDLKKTIAELKKELSGMTKLASEHITHCGRYQIDLDECRKNVAINLLKVGAMVDAIRGKCQLKPFDDGYLPEIEEAKQLRSSLDEAREALEWVMLDPVDGYEHARIWLASHPKVTK
jgi:hypothetical protein